MKPSDYSFDDMLAVHERHMNQTTLPGVFGDGYLNSKSKIFRNVRARALETGVVFAPANEGWLFQYTYYPLGFLGKSFAGLAVRLPFIYFATQFMMDEAFRGWVAQVLAFI